MLLQSLRLAWPIFSQGWPLFYFCHLWATQLLIHMQMKLTPALVCISARCFSAQHTAFRAALLILSTAVAQLLERGEGKKSHIPGRDTQGRQKKRKRYTGACLRNLSVWSLTALQTHAACLFALPLQRFGGGSEEEEAEEGREREPVAPLSGWGVALWWQETRKLAMRPARWVEYAADDLRGRVKFLHNRRARRTPAVTQPEQDAQRERLRWSHRSVLLSVLLSSPPPLLRSKLLSLNLLPLLCFLPPLLHTFTPLLSPLRTYSALSWSLYEKWTQSFSVVGSGSSSSIKVFAVVRICSQSFSKDFLNKKSCFSKMT